MPARRYNKTIAGYHILMILSALDHEFHIEEEKIIREYLFQEFPFKVDLDKEMEVISSLGHDDWHTHMVKCIDDFYADSTEEERNSFLKFAVYLVKADQEITESENEYLKLLFDAWDFSRE
ncbi:MAG: TerB family tellurite resistance protein [Chitinophagaceae bacterium]|nr:TerB family tellurite resistance protein [Chitinophagaceae bacterium]